MAPPSKRPTPARRAGDYTQTYEIDLTRTPCARHHVVLLDGTWNDEQGTPWTNPLTGQSGHVVTNLVKLDRALAADSSTQLVSYHRGIGNRLDNRRHQQIFTGASGADEVCIRAAAFAQLVLDYLPGDIISIFGFSRGASCARMLANDLACHGIPDRIAVTRRLWNGEYRIVSTRIPANAKRRPVDVAYLGLWDTVGAFGVPMDIGPLRFGKINVGKNLDLAPNVRRAVHCVALDEDRKAFAPVLLEGPEKVVDEVWFPGVHSDVGGGYGFDALGKITMAYQLKQWEDALAQGGAPALAWSGEARASLLPAAGDVIVRHHHGAAKGSRRPRPLVATGDRLPRVHVSVETLIANGAGLLAASDEREAPILRHYLPPNFTSRDRHVLVRS